MATMDSPSTLNLTRPQDVGNHSSCITSSLKWWNAAEMAAADRAVGLPAMSRPESCACAERLNSAHGHWRWPEGRPVANGGANQFLQAPPPFVVLFLLHERLALAGG